MQRKFSESFLPLFSRMEIEGISLITSHLGADFDSFGSIIAGLEFYVFLIKSFETIPKPNIIMAWKPF